MPRRATKRGIERTPLARDCDVLICGASFAGLAVARELAGSGADVLLIDRYEIGERQTSACGIPTGWLEALDLQGSLRQTFGELVLHTPYTTARYRLPWTFSTFDYRSSVSSCSPTRGNSRSRLRRSKVDPLARIPLRVRLTPNSGAGPVASSTPTAATSAPAWSWTRLAGGGCSAPAITSSRPDALLSRGLEVHPEGSGDDMEIWIDRSYVPAGYGWSFPAGGEVRIGVGSFDPRFHVREPTERLATDLSAESVRYQGNWIPHALRNATEDGVFFVGDSAGHCLPLTAEGIRTALYFGLAVGREVSQVLDGRRSIADALSSYSRFSASHARAFAWMLRCQRLVPRVTPRLLAGALRAMEARRFLDWAFGHYLEISHPRFVAAGPRRTPLQVRVPA